MVNKINNETVIKLSDSDGEIAVKNLPDTFEKISHGKYLVVTEVDGEYWYYGLYKSAFYARDAVIENPNARYFFYIK